MRYIKVAFERLIQLFQTQILSLSAEKKRAMNIFFCIFVIEWFSEILHVIGIKANMYWSIAMKYSQQTY